jgi:TonB-linked SusC/RagA family outer membrane protein
MKRTGIKSNFIRNMACLLSVAAVPGLAEAQITGTVSEATNREALSGVTVRLKGRQTYATTDATGHYRIEAAKDDTLVFSFVGLQTLEESVQGRSRVDVALDGEQQQLNEVVVVGYGTQRRRELTGAIAGVSSTHLEYNTAPSIDGLLGGAVAGVNVTRTSGQPGAASSTRIRGGTSVYADNEPLYVIDGFIFFNERNATQAGVAGIESSLNPLASLNPSDIESVEILKDVSAKAIYGSRGANGVILVTTKKGLRNRNEIRYQYTLGVDVAARRLELFDAPQWARWAESVSLSYDGVYLSDGYLAGIGKGSDWQDAVLRTALSHTHELSLGGGNGNTRYMVSGSYTDRDGVVLNSGFRRYGGRVNLDKSLYGGDLTVGVVASADRSVQDALSSLTAGDFAGSSSPFKSGITNSLVYALFMPPVLPIRKGSGFNYDNPFELTELHYYDRAANPVSDLENSLAQTVSTSLLANFHVKYSLPFLPGLSVRANVGANMTYITRNLFAPPYTALGINQDIQGRASVGNRRTDVTQTEWLIAYTNRLGGIHFLDLLGGYTVQNTRTNFLYNKVTHIDSFDNLAKTSAPGDNLLPPASRSDEAELRSVIGRVNYSLLQRYNLTATFRADKSSRFPTGHKWGYFPSLGVSWNVSDEPFFAAAAVKKVVSSLKLRLTGGSSGNQEIGFNDYAAYFNAVRYNGQSALAQTTIYNPDLKWETTSEYNAGIDAGLWNGRVTVVFDVYSKKTFDLLTKTPPPLGSSSGELQTVNLGNLTNRGFELSVAATLAEREKFSWTANVNFARNVNTVTDLGKYSNMTEGDSQERILRTGEAAGSFYGYVFEGVVQANDDVSKLPTVSGTRHKPGDIKLRDISGPDGTPDGKITPEHDRTVIGSIQPDFTYGLSSALRLGRWDLFVSLQGSQGNRVYNKLRRHLSENNSSYNRSAELLDAWTENNPSNSIPAWNSVIDANTLYSRYVEDGSFLRLKTLTLGYTVDNLKFVSPTVKLRVFVSAYNLLLLSPYKGYDPEVAGGIDTGIYPAARSFYLGVVIKLL